MNKLTRLALVLIMTWLLFSGCQPAQPALVSTPQKPAEQRRLLIGVSVLDLANPYYVQVVEGIKSAAVEQEIDLLINDPKSSVDNQIKAIQGFIDRKVDAIIVTALDPLVVDPLLAIARSQGIKVLAHFTKVENADIFVGADEWDMGHTIGRAAGEWIRDKLGGRAQVAILNYPRIPQIANREKGIRDGIAEIAPNAVIVAARLAGQPNEGYIATRDILEKFPDVQVIVGINDGGALGALRALQEIHLVGRDSLFFVGGCDATPDALNQMRGDTAYRATVDITPYENGRMGVEFALKLIRGQILPDRYSISIRLIKQADLLP